MSTKCCQSLLTKPNTHTYPTMLTLVGGFQNEISSDLVGKIESVLLKTNLNTHSMLSSYTMSFDALLYFEYTREFSRAYSHVHIGTKIPKLVVSERQKMPNSQNMQLGSIQRLIQCPWAITRPSKPILGYCE